VSPDWAAVHGAGQRRRVPLPTYPVEGQRHWVEAGDPLALAVKTDHALHKKADIADWFYLPSWTRALAAPGLPGKTGWLLFNDRVGLAERLAPRLPGAITVSAGERFARSGPDAYTVRPGDRADCDALLQTLQTQGRMPRHVVHLWAVGPQVGGAEAAHAQYFESLVVLAQSLSNDEQPVELTVVSSGLQQVAAEAPIEPHKALLLGPCRVIPHEFPLIRTRSIDVVLPAAPSWQADRLCEQLLVELASSPSDHAVALRGGERWVESFQPTRLPPVTRRAWLRDGGVYLITGGLGGIGLELGAHLAQAAAVKLVLVGRSGLPERDQWAALLADRNTPDTLARKIAQVLSIEARGAEVVIARADVTDETQMRDVVAQARERFGALHGVVHAAGSIDDELMLMKSPESALGVIGPKVRGAIVLDTVLRGTELDFFVLFSSVSSILGLQGQVDYTAANAFLDAFARDRSTRERSRTVAINWSAWQDVGMVAAITAHAAQRAAPVAVGVAQQTSHPWLERHTASSHDSVFSTAFSGSKQWLLAEHVVIGSDALIPGTGFLELARAALEECAEPAVAMGASGAPRPRSVQITDVFFLAPFAVPPAETRELRLTLHKDTGEFVVSSVAPGTAGAGPNHALTHVTGKVAHVEASPQRQVDIEAIRRRCADRIEVLDGFMDQRFMAFGPRWGNLKSILYGHDEALVSLELPAAWQADLQDFHLHPALLDMATGSAQGLIHGFDRSKDFFVPFSYGRLVLRAALPTRLFSHVRAVAGSERNMAVFNVSLFDEHGVEVAEISDFVMRRVDDRAALAASAAAPAATPHAAATALTVFREGMLAAEGMEALDRILGAGVSPQIVASSIDLHDWIAVTDAVPGTEETGAAEPGATPASQGARPSLSTSFVAPRDALEQQVAAIWQKMLGIDAVGVHDDFFELGGHSLLLTQTVTRIRKMAQVDVPLRALFAKPTIGEIADEIRKAQEQPATKAAPALIAVSREGYRVKRS
jgi:acyl transferase domain-containing protein